MGIPEGIRGLVEAVGDRRVSVTEVIEATLSAVQSGQPALNAYITIDADGALNAARNLDASARRSSQPLLGVPLAIKDNIDVRGLRTTMGSPLGQDTADRDAAVVRRLKRAGAVVIGKASLHEFALGTSNHNPHFGPTRNPWDVARSPGGSSGGSAAAVAGGQAYGGLGTDSGGSVRIPAAMCGLVGLKPTYGRVSLAGVRGSPWSLDHVGPLGRSVADVAILFDSMAGPHRGDLSTGPRRGRRTASEKRGSIGVVTDPHPEGPTAEAVTAAAKILEEDGYRVERVSLGDLSDVPFCAAAITYPEIASQHGRWPMDSPDEYGPDILPLIRAGHFISATDYLMAQRMRNVYRRTLSTIFASVDYILSPTTPVTAQLLDEARSDGPASNERLFALMQYTWIFNLTGHPAVSSPFGLDPKGLPIGVQIVGRPYDEKGVLALAAMVERSAPRIGDPPYSSAA